MTYDVTAPPHYLKLGHFGHSFAMIRSPGGATGQCLRSVVSVLIGRQSYDVISSRVTLMKNSRKTGMVESSRVTYDVTAPHLYIR